ncbi:MAG: hypothetical protein NVV60_05950 [Luteimonas sp.]|nr:hypothetical protein [Luteimonas sp.]
MPSPMLWVFTLEARPLPDSPDFETAGGAFVVCYVRPELADDPLGHATAYVRGQDWQVVAVEDEPLECGRDEAPDEDYFDQAIDDGEVYVFHQWPIDDIGLETRH